MNFDKKLKSGLPKCPLHRFGAEYNWVKYNWFECEKCHKYHQLDLEIMKNLDGHTRVKINPDKRGVNYTLI